MKPMKLILAAAALMFMSAPVTATPVVGEAAPDFTATDIKGETFKLSDHKGKIVVLEWTNHKCPFVIKHYDSGNMQKIQKTVKDMGVEWVSIVSSAPDHQGHVSPEEAQKILEEAGAQPTAKILDESGEVGRLYEAKTTPHMFVIDEEGQLAYAGAIDSNPSPRASAIEGATNFVLDAVEDLKADRAVRTAQTAPYGCGVKYKR